jgi:glucuronate isomerase
MKKFLNDDFLLDGGVAEELYRNAAAEAPVVDYHNHLNPAWLAEDKSFDTITGFWIAGDQYKHRAMRINGIPERYITGDASPEEKFVQWAKTLPKTIGNPLFHWSCVELKHIFGIGEVLCESNAEKIWEQCNSQIADRKLSVRKILRAWNARTLCTSDDLLDDLSHHVKASRHDDGMTVLPTLRGDSIIAFDGEWMKRFAEVSTNGIDDLAGYLAAVSERLDRFDEAGCRLSDHSLDAGFKFAPTTDEKAGSIYKKIAEGHSLTPDELPGLQSFVLVRLGVEYSRRGWTLQLHIGAQRSTSSRLRTFAGAAGGYACIGSGCDVDGLCRLLDAMEREGHLPRVILYTLNPADNAVMATLTGSFAEDGVPGKIQFGPAWWYNDFPDAIREQLTALAGYGMLSRFVGMTTDARSVLSFSRHDYFRRILCDMIGEWVEKGLVPHDKQLLEQMVKDISYGNAEKMINKRQ